MVPTALHILVPGLLERIPGVDKLSPPVVDPFLQRLLSRANLENAAGSDLESTLCHLFGIKRGENGGFPIAALRRESGAHTGGDGRFWLQAEPVCLRPDQSRLLLFDTRDFDVSSEELKLLGELFISHFESEGWVIDVDDPFCWYISTDNSTNISSHSLGDAFGRNMDLFLPQGGDRLQWHRLLNEVQMLFFGSEVNMAREAMGKMPIGGLWFSGFGRLPESVLSPYQQIFGDDALSVGLARLSGATSNSLQACNDELLPKSGASLLLYPHLQRSVWRADPLDWAEKIGSLSAWLELRVDDLVGDRLDELLLYSCNGRVFRLSRLDRYRFWRGSKPLLAWLQAGD